MKNTSFNDATEEIKGRLNIIDLIEEYLSLKKSGKGYVGLCPFHDDKNPSMHVSPDKGLFHCFSCGAGGDIFGFIMRYNNIGFVEAVTELAKKTNVILPSNKSVNKTSTQQNLLYKINDLISHYYHKNLISNKNSVKARDYLKFRGINIDIAKNFKIGYSPDSWDSLIKLVRSNKIKLSHVEETGLIIRKSGSDNFYDRFRDRIIFPIIDINGKIVGFGGRSLNEEQQPKYLNSPESKIFQKRNIFYGLFNSKDEIRRSKKAIIVEGYMDYLTLYKYDVKNVVATLGTSLTKQHCILIKRFCDEVIIIYDGDPSGINSAIRAGELFIEEGITAKIVVLPENHDPDSYISEFGKEKFSKIVDNSKNVADYIIENINERYNKGDISSRESTKLIVELLSGISNPVEKGRYLSKASGLLGIRETDLISLINLKRKKTSRPDFNDTSYSQLSTERMIVRILLNYPQMLNEINTDKLYQYFEDNELKVIFKEIIENKFNDISSFINNFEDSVYQELISEMVFSSDDLIDNATSKKILDNCINKFELEDVNLKLKNIRFKIQELKGTQDENLERKLLAEYRDLVELEKSLRGNINDVQKS